MADLYLAHLQDLVAEASRNPDFDLLTELTALVGAVEDECNFSEER